MKTVIICICILLICLAVIFFIRYIDKMLKGKCCEGCSRCAQKNNCSNFQDGEKTDTVQYNDSDDNT